MTKDAERRARLAAAMRGVQPPEAASPARPDARPAAPRPVGPPVTGLARVVDRRGLTAAGLAAVELVAGLVGAAYDLSRGPQILGTVTAIVFAVAAITAAALTHREDLVASVVAPPLAYAAVVLVAANMSGSGAGGSYLHDVGADVVVHVVTSAPGVLIGTLGAGVVALLRFLSGRAAANRRRAAARAGRPGAR